MDMVLALHQSLSSGISSCGAKSCSTASCFSFGHSDFICYYDEFFCFFFFWSLVQKAPVCLICKECFQLPLVAMTDGRTIKSKRAPQCAIFYVEPFFSLLRIHPRMVFKCLFSLRLLSALFLPHGKYVWRTQKKESREGHAAPALTQALWLEERTTALHNDLTHPSQKPMEETFRSSFRSAAF